MRPMSLADVAVYQSIGLSQRLFFSFSHRVPTRYKRQAGTLRVTAHAHHGHARHTKAAASWFLGGIDLDCGGHRPRRIGALLQYGDLL